MTVVDLPDSVCWHVPNPPTCLVLKLAGFRRVASVKSEGRVNVVGPDGNVSVPS